MLRCSLMIPNFAAPVCTSRMLPILGACLNTTIFCSECEAHAAHLSMLRDQCREKCQSCSALLYIPKSYNGSMPTIHNSMTASFISFNVLGLVGLPLIHMSIPPGAKI